MSPMTKAIMREIHSDDNVCEVCQPNKCPHGSKIFTSFCGRGADLGKKLIDFLFVFSLLIDFFHTNLIFTPRFLVVSQYELQE